MFGIKKMKRMWHEYMVDHCPRKVIDKIWRNKYGHEIDWNHPQDINEKIQWLICYGDTSKWPLLADKYKVRDYIKEKGYENLLPILYGVWNDANDIDFSKLPEKFILKCNHDSGTYFIVNKKGYNKDEIVSELNKALKRKFGYDHCEPHYNKIKPLIVAEELLEDHNKSLSTSLIDYKVWCFDGKPYSIWVCRNRDHNGTDTSLFDLEWHYHPENSVFTSYFRDGGGEIPKPVILDEMLTAAANLSKGFPEVRMDFYIVNGKLYFGEMTFTSSTGKMDFYTKDYLNKLGAQCILPYK